MVKLVRRVRDRCKCHLLALRTRDEWSSGRWGLSADFDSDRGQIPPSVRVAHLWDKPDVELAKKRSDKTIADSDRHAARIHKEEVIELKEIKIKKQE